MKIPNDAIIQESKLTHYLLVHREKNDKSKFLAQGGFTDENPQDLESAIRQLISSYDAVEDTRNEYGDLFRVEGDLMGINGRILGVLSIWMIQSSVDNVFRFVTLKPARKRKNET
jgi:hypothetical protein